MRNTRKDVTTFGTDVIKKTERVDKVSFRICKLPKPRKRSGMIILGITLIAGLVWLIDKS